MKRKFETYLAEVYLDLIPNSCDYFTKKCVATEGERGGGPKNQILGIKGLKI